MALLNSDCPFFKVYIRRSYYTQRIQDLQFFDEAMVFGLQSLNNRIITFHVMFDFGMVRARVPISEIYWRKPDDDLAPHFKQLWDSFGEEFSVTEFEYLSGKRAQIILKDGKQVWGTYVFTVDWYNNSFSETADQAKSAHIFKADPGYFLAQPNNRIVWSDMNWVSKKFPVDK
jgi:hypothetical protein